MLRYHLQKILILLNEHRYRLNHKLTPTNYGYLKPGHQSATDGVLFDFCHPQFHLGDRIFHFGAIQALARQGVPVLVREPTPLISLLVPKNSPIQFIAHAPSANFLVVTRQDLMHVYEKRYPTQAILGISFKKIKDQRIGDGIYTAITEHYPSPASRDLLPRRTDWAPSLESTELPASLPPRYVVFNDFIASGFIELPLQRPKLRRLAKRLKELNLPLVYVSGKKEAHYRAPSFIDLDKRGGLSWVEFLALMASDQVAKVITFDNMIAHLACLFGHEVYIMSRKRAWKPWLETCVFPLSKVLPVNNVHVCH